MRMKNNLHLCCLILGHDPLPWIAPTGWRPFVPWVTCKKCGQKSPLVFSFIHGWLNYWGATALAILGGIRVEIKMLRRWLERNDLPLF
jgi:hypothetical protein